MLTTEETTFSICLQLEQIYLLTAGAVAAVTTAAGTEILTDDLQIIVLLNHPAYPNFIKKLDLIIAKIGMPFIYLTLEWVETSVT